MIKTIKHGINLIRHSLRDAGLPKRSSKWEEVEKHFRELNPKCACCGSIKNINIHHAKPFHLFPQLELEPNNLITLCMSSEQIGHGNSFKFWNPNVKNDVAKINQNIGLFEKIAAEIKLHRLKN